MDVMPHDGVGNHFCYPIGFGVRNLQDAGDITHGVFGHHFTEGDDITHALKTIFIRTVLNDFVTTSILDVSINIWHTDAVGI